VPILVLAAAILAIPLGLDLYLPVPDDNPLSAERIELGRRLFSDRRLSRDRTIACATCHQPRRAFSDGRALARGIDGRTGRRNAPALINRGYGRAFFWDGRERTLEAQVLKPIADPHEMDFSPEAAARRVGLTTDGLAHALASYVRSILSSSSGRCDGWFDRRYGRTPATSCGSSRQVRFGPAATHSDPCATRMAPPPSPVNC
jgi:cytochrome c peroxidase